MEQKPGYKTSELWVTLVTTIGALITGYELLSKEEVDSLVKVAIVLVEVAPVLMYTWSRTLVKVKTS